MLPIIGPWLVKKGLSAALRAGIQIIIVLAIAFVVYLAFDSVRDHFKHITDIENQNEQLKTKVTQVEGQRDEAIRVNESNKRTSILKDEIENSREDIAAEERSSSATRAQAHKEIRDEINSTPQPADARPVAPVIRDTLDKLWGGTGTPSA